MNGKVEKSDWFLNDNPSLTRPVFYDRQTLDKLIAAAAAGETNYYGETDTFLFECLSKYPVTNKSVAIIGSAKPWYEAICLAYGGAPVTIDYNKIESNDNRLTLLTVDECKNKAAKFDAVFSISTFEHDGLGRYGDPIDPDGDLRAMRYVRDNLLNDKGLLYLSVPVGLDRIFWNAHRIYGVYRWPKLIEGFEIVYSCGLNRERLETDTGKEVFQPVVVLKKSGSNGAIPVINGN